MSTFLKGGYLDRALAHMRAYSALRDGSLLFYAALEFRFSIERLLFLYLTIVRAKISKRQEQMYRARDLKAAILDVAPDFLQKLEFANLCLEGTSHRSKIPIPDLDQLTVLYGKLGGYLHAIKTPDDTLRDPKWWLQFHKVLRHVETALARVASQPIPRFELNEAGLSLFDDFKAGRVTPEDVKASFRRGC